MKKITVEYENIDLVLHGEHYEGEERTYMYPGGDEDFTIYKVFCGGQDIMDILEQHIIDDLEIIAIKEIEEDEYDCFI